jgi:hypothetical protein
MAVLRGIDLLAVKTHLGGLMVPEVHLHIWAGEH